MSTGALRQGKNHAKTCRSRTEGNRKGNMGYQAHGTGEGGKGVDSVREDKERYPSLPCPFSNTIHPPQALARTVEGLGQLSHGRGGTREPIAGRFQTIASPSLSSFTSEELAASLQGLSLLGRSLSAEFSARAEAGRAREGGKVSGGGRKGEERAWWLFPAALPIQSVHRHASFLPHFTLTLSRQQSFLTWMIAPSSSSSWRYTGTLSRSLPLVPAPHVSSSPPPASLPPSAWPRWDTVLGTISSMPP